MAKVWYWYGVLVFLTFRQGYRRFGLVCRFSAWSASCHAPPPVCPRDPQQQTLSRNNSRRSKDSGSTWSVEMWHCRAFERRRVAYKGSNNVIVRHQALVFSLVCVIVLLKSQIAGTNSRETKDQPEGRGRTRRGSASRELLRVQSLGVVNLIYDCERRNRGDVLVARLPRDQGARGVLALRVQKGQTH